MKDSERVESGDYKFGLGIAISEIVHNYWNKQNIDESKMLTLTSLEDDEEVSYDGDLEELRVICENEGFSFVATKYFIPIDSTSETCSSWNNDEFILLVEINPDEDDADGEHTEHLKECIKKFKHLQDYFELDSGIKRLNYYFYFPENVIINEEGHGCAKFTFETEWEHRERFGEHDHD